MLSTCNRTEVYAVAERFHGAYQDIRDFLAELAFLAPDSGPLVDVLVIPATIAEFWMIGWLLYTGWRRPTDPRPTPAAR